ncbi:MAG: GGDEF domain-containing protein [Gammaproteobacteria bacterium]
MLENKKGVDSLADARRARALHEENERANEEALTRLQKSALRFAFSLFGRYPELDRAINALRTQLRSSRRSTDINNAIQDILGLITRLETEPGARTETAPASGAALQDLISRIHWPAAEAEEAARLRQRAGGTEGEGATVEALAAAFNRLIAAAAAPAGPAAEVGAAARSMVRMLDRIDAPAGFADALTGIRQKIGGIAEQAQLLSAFDEVAQTISRFLHAPETVPGETAQPPPTPERPWGEPLLELLERVSMPADLSRDVAALKQRLMRPVAVEERSGLVTQVGNLIERMRAALQTEIDAIGAFLRQVLLRLQNLHLHVLQSGRVRGEAFKDSERVSAMVLQHVSGIRTSMDAAASLEELKASVHSSLEGIDADMNTFLEAERRRNEEADHAVVALNSQLQDLESETMQLRESLKVHQEKASRDALTGVANRFGYEERLNQELARWRRHGRPLSLVVFDIDYFKSINDQYGHQAGDRVLVTVADQMRSHIRESDFFARYGGEEFVLLLPETRLEDAYVLADKLRQNIERCKFRYGESPVPVTISCGVTEFQPGDEPQQAFERADGALYHAKRSGRNRCCRDTEVPAA